MINRYAFSVLACFLAMHIAVAAKPESKGPAPDAMVMDLYKTHDAERGPFFDRKNRKLAAQYFTGQLAALIVTDAVKSEGEVGAYEFDPMYASQDPAAKNFKIGSVQWGRMKTGIDDLDDEDFALVKVAFDERGEQRQLRFGFERQTDKTWRISDIHYPDGTSLLQILRAAYPD